HGGDRSLPWLHELAEDEVRNVAAFVHHLRTEPGSALNLLARAEPEFDIGGRLIYKSRCALCHGDDGGGDGRLAQMIKNPPPSNLAASRLSRDAAVAIIAGGGESVQRSGQMPPWGAELTGRQILALVDYVFALRENGPHGR
ncbi:MAG: cytochrome c, partial [Pseudomonadota bacterium]